MAGVRTAPDVTTAATFRQLHVRWIDNSGDITSEAYLVPAAATTAQIEAMLDALQACSNASLFEASISQHWGGDALADAAIVHGCAYSKRGIAIDDSPNELRAAFAFQFYRLRLLLRCENEDKYLRTFIHLR